MCLRGTYNGRLWNVWHIPREVQVKKKKKQPVRVCLHAAYATAGDGPLPLRMATGPCRIRLFMVVKLPLAF